MNSSRKTLFVCNRGDMFMCQDGLRTKKLCQSPIDSEKVLEIYNCIAPMSHVHLLGLTKMLKIEYRGGKIHTQFKLLFEF